MAVGWLVMLRDGCWFSFCLTVGFSYCCQILNGTDFGFFFNSRFFLKGCCYLLMGYKFAKVKCKFFF